jgi:hypothetical protein
MAMRAGSIIADFHCAAETVTATLCVVPPSMTSISADPSPRPTIRFSGVTSAMSD